MVAISSIQMGARSSGTTRCRRSAQPEHSRTGRPVPRKRFSPGDTMQKQKFIRQLATAVAVSATFSFVGAASAQEAGKLLVWINGDKGYNGLQKVGDEFAKKAGITVTVEHPEDAPGKFSQAAAAGKGPDIFCWPHDRMGEWAQSGLIVPINPSKKVRDDIEETAWKAFNFHGKTWGYPISVEAIGLVYNKALVKTAPKSFDDVVKL